MKKMKVLGKTAIILTSEEMLRKFGEKIDYIVDNSNKTIYIDRNLIDKEIKKYNGHLTIEDTVEDIYRMIRDMESRKSMYEIIQDTIPRSRIKK
jgi:hypothetical protein